MSEMTTEQAQGRIDFGRTDTMTRAVHLVECPHLVQKQWHPATEQDLATLPVCSWSRDQLVGHGRSHPLTLEEAIREHGTPEAAVRPIKEALRFVTFDEIWLPYSRSYVALGLDGRAVASFGKSYVQVGDQRVDLPDHVAARRAGHTTAPARGELCPRCFIQMPLTGICDDCA